MCIRDSSEFGRAQANNFDALAALGYDLVAMPTIEDFARLYMHEQNGDFVNQKILTILPDAKNG